MAGKLGQYTVEWHIIQINHLHDKVHAAETELQTGSEGNGAKRAERPERNLYLSA